MNLTFLIGNGFDLNIGLNTRYSDFLKAYKEINDGDDENIKSLKKSIVRWFNNDINSVNWSDMEAALGEYTSNYDENNSNSGELMEEVHDDICEHLSNYLLSEEKKFPNELTGEKMQKIHLLAGDLVQYNKCLSNDDQHAIGQITKNVPGNLTLYFLDFNYTNILDRIVGYIQKDEQLGYRNGKRNKIDSIIHVHGTVEYGMALGVNDEGQLKKDIFGNDNPEHKRSLIKPVFNKDMGESVEETATQIINNSDVIYIYGMSMGITDNRWWERIAKWLNKKKSAILIYNSKSVPIVKLSPEKYIAFRRRFRDDFVDHLVNGKQEDKDSMKDRIHIARDDLFKRIKKLV